MNQKTFGIKLFYQKSYSLIISGITQLLHWLLKIKINFTMTASFKYLASFIIKNNITLTLSSIFPEFKAYITQKINGSMSILVLTLYENRYISSKINEYLTFSYLKIANRRRVYSALISALVLTVTSSAATFFPLSLYDIENLETLDPYTLVYMDKV